MRIVSLESLTFIFNSMLSKMDRVTMIAGS
jgi:hypothetical protein